MKTTTEAAQVLTIASGIDNRSFTLEVADLWATMLDDQATVEDLCKAVLTHYTNSTEYLKPAHVNEIVANQRRVRARDLPDVTPPRDLADEPHREVEWKRIWGDAVIAGHTEDKARDIANQQLGVSDDELLAIGAGPVGTLRETHDRTTREIAAKERLEQINAELKRQAKVKRRAEQAEAEKVRTAAREPKPEREIRDPADVVASHTEESADV